MQKTFCDVKDCGRELNVKQRFYPIVIYQKSILLSWIAQRGVFGDEKKLELCDEHFDEFAEKLGINDN